MGDGPVDLLVVSGWVSHLEQAWEAPGARRFYERLGEFSRLILYDPRGSGLSDDVGDIHSLEQEAADALAVLDAAGSDRAAIYARWVGGPIGLFLAAEHPERIDAIVMVNSVASTGWAPDYDWAMTPEEREQLIDQGVGEWGEDRSREVARCGAVDGRRPCSGGMVLTNGPVHRKSGQGQETVARSRRTRRTACPVEDSRARARDAPA